MIPTPYNPTLYKKEVEVIIVPKMTKLIKGLKATDFVSIWTVFLNDPNIDDRNMIVLRKYINEKGSF